jgi:hypothetical protein
MYKPFLNYLFAVFFLLALSACDPGMGSIRGGESFSSTDTGGGSSSPGVGAPGNPQSQPGVITAGEWKDQDHWDFWEGLWQNDDYNSTRETWEFKLENRFAIQVLDQNGQFFSNVEAALLDNNNKTIWEAKTDNQGKAELWADIFENDNDPGNVKLKFNGQNLGTFEVKKFEAAGDLNVINVGISRSYHEDLDVYFVVDATGSMGDELEFLKTELLDVITRVKTNHTNLNVRLGATFYRDESDKYLTRDFPLTQNVNSIINDVKKQSADGGGDYPEAVHSGLKSAIAHQNWSNDAIARLVFLILDAPPHDNEKVKEELEKQITDAARNGVKIIPVVASGVNKETEFLMRFFTLATNGTYVFITDDSGIGNDHLEPTVGEFEIEFLNDLIVRVIEENSVQ